MKVGVIVLLMKRLITALCAIAIVTGYLVYDSIATTRERRLARQIALVTAQTWLGRAQLRDDHRDFQSYRDSLLSESGLSREEIGRYANRQRPEAYEEFVKLIKYYVDSLYELQVPKSGPDSATILDSVTVDTSQSTSRPGQ
ncbi:MAG TPA: hypothetical protein VN285_00995 [Candidatus Deferrimicrobium sp.]|nr:hypothetical protein [Candidatus Deferrimicrobium sp.]